MGILNMEIKSRIKDPNKIERLLKRKNAIFAGEDHQIDTYFKVDKGRLKLRQGNIENTLIFYDRVETKNIKKSNVLLQKLSKDSEGIKAIMDKILGIKVVVNKKRKIYFIDNVKFHLDEVAGLGTFAEIEAINDEKNNTEEKLREQCEYFIDFLQLDRSEFIDKSYSDMIIGSFQQKQ